MNIAEKMLLNELQQLDSLDNYFNDVDEMPLTSKNVGVTLRRGDGQPAYKAQIDIIIKPIFILVASGTTSIIEPSELPSGLKVALPAFMFGQADYSGGFPNAIAKLPALGLWSLQNVFIYGVYGSSVVQTTLNPLLKRGDLVIEYQYNAGGGNIYLGYIIVSSDNVAYGTLLAATNSDRFVIDTVRYSVNNDLYTPQLKNQLVFIFQTLFGKASDDKISPTSFINPRNTIKYIADIPFTKGIDKNISIGTYVNYDVPEIVFSIFIKDFKKIEA